MFPERLNVRRPRIENRKKMITNKSRIVKHFCLKPRKKLWIAPQPVMNEQKAMRKEGITNERCLNYQPL